jgi:hypothetical protein
MLFPNAGSFQAALHPKIRWYVMQSFHGQLYAGVQSLQHHVELNVQR